MPGDSILEDREGSKLAQAIRSEALSKRMTSELLGTKRPALAPLSEPKMVQKGHILEV